MKTITIFFFLFCASVSLAQDAAIYFGIGGSLHRRAITLSFLKDDTTSHSLHPYWGVEIGYGFDGDAKPANANDYDGEPLSHWDIHSYTTNNYYLSALIMLRTGYYHFGAVIGMRLRGAEFYYYSSASDTWWHKDGGDQDMKLFPELGVRAGAGTAKVIFSFEYTIYRGLGAEIAFNL